MASNGVVTLDESSIKDRHISDTAQIDRDKMAQRILAVKGISFTDFRVWDALQTNLPGTSATDDLALITGTWGSDAPYVGTSDLKAAGSTTRRAACFMVLPADYEAAETVTISVTGGMKTTVADNSATVDIECWRIDEDGTLGAADICATSAQSINSLVAGAKDFVITATTLEPGDLLYVRLTLAVNDAATLTAVIGAVWKVDLLADLR